MDPDEIINFKNNIDLLSDEELDKYLNDCDSDLDFTDSDIDSLQSRLNDEIKEDRSRIFIHRFYKICAAILLPLLLLCGGILVKYHGDIGRYESLLSKDINLETDNGESIVTVLPDGSQVEMGPKSNLTYCLGTFADDQRLISFAGEGSFKIAHLYGAPFTLKTASFEIEVLGTEFSVVSRQDEDNSEVYLEKGSIRLSALSSDQSFLMKPGEMAILSQKSGNIQLVRDHSVKRRAGLPVIFFDSSPIVEISEKIKLYYGVEVLGGEQIENVSFTGSLPTNNLSQLIFVLETTLKISINYDEASNTLTMKQ